MRTAIGILLWVLASLVNILIFACGLVFACPFLPGGGPQATGSLPIYPMAYATLNLVALNLRSPRWRVVLAASANVPLACLIVWVFYKCLGDFQAMWLPGILAEMALVNVLAILWNRPAARLTSSPPPSPAPASSPSSGSRTPR